MQTEKIQKFRKYKCWYREMYEYKTEEIYAQNATEAKKLFQICFPDKVFRKAEWVH